MKNGVPEVFILRSSHGKVPISPLGSIGKIQEKGLLFALQREARQKFPGSMTTYFLSGARIKFFSLKGQVECACKGECMCRLTIEGHGPMLGLKAWARKGRSIEDQIRALFFLLESWLRLKVEATRSFEAFFRGHCLLIGPRGRPLPWPKFFFPTEVCQSENLQRMDLVGESMLPPLEDDDCPKMRRKKMEEQSFFFSGSVGLEIVCLPRKRAIQQAIAAVLNCDYRAICLYINSQILRNNHLSSLDDTDQLSYEKVSL